MNTIHCNRTPALLALTLTTTLAATALADEKTQKWTDLPPAVQATILAHGGVAGQDNVDRETPSHNVNGQTLYEAPVTDAQGNRADLEITADGTLVETKHDDAYDRKQELAAAASPAKPGKKGKKAVLQFSHPRDITNPYLPLAYLNQDVLEGSEEGKKLRVERTLRPEKVKLFTLGHQTVAALAMEDRVFENGQLAEVALDYFAEDDFGNVYYLGEDVDEYTNGKVASHDGSWLLGKDTQTPGLIIPAHPKVGDQFKSEDVSKEIMEADEVVAVDETVTVPGGTFRNCVKIAEHAAGEGTEYKWYAPGVGVVREKPADGDELLMAHTAREGLVK